jgi:hypothetical protein
MAAGTAYGSRNQKSKVMSPQSATPTSISDHSEGFNPNSLPSLITYVIICMYSVLTGCTVATVDGGGCSAQVTDAMNLVPEAGTKTPTRGHTSGAGKIRHTVVHLIPAPASIECGRGGPSALTVDFAAANNTEWLIWPKQCHWLAALLPSSCHTLMACFGTIEPKTRLLSQRD